MVCNAFQYYRKALSTCSYIYAHSKTGLAASSFACLNYMLLLSFVPGLSTPWPPSDVEDNPT